MSARLEVGESACFALARSPGCGWFLFEARLSGYCVGEGVKRVNLGFSVLEHADLEEWWGSGKTSAGRRLLRGHVVFGL